MRASRHGRLLIALHESGNGPEPAGAYSVFARPARWIRPPQRSISEARNFCNSAGGGLSTGMVPIRTITSPTSGVAATALSSAYRRSITGLGVADGAQIIVQPTASKPGTPASAIVGP